MKKNIFFAALTVILISTATEIQAQIKGEALLGYGFNDAFKFGFGARAGKDGLIESQPQVYLGGVFAYHLGRSEGSGDAKTSNSLWYAAADAGYNVPLEGQPFKLRASAYVGIASASVTSNFFGVSRSASSNEFLIAPGATATFPLSGNLTIGGDARFFIVSGANAFVLNATLGTTF